ncbi:uncharacterized protein LOC143838692 isoform X2 [Paroedura picta]|uniref:uncharacterized protein LOC143838692 isoform X2 n=1 Tax=Paroedura picta TaxID=143630 RepID=UPI00405651A4
MDTRGPGLQSLAVRDLHCLHHGLFRTSTERAQLRAAVHQVFGGQPWGGCCSDRLLETLLDAGQRSYLKQQLYWDFQLLDSDHDGYLSVRDAELLLAQVPHAAATGEAWQDFLRSRGPTVAWRDIEDWLFRAIQLPGEEPRAGRRRPLHHQRGTSTGGSSTSLYRWGARSRTEQPLERWDSGGLATLLGEEPSRVLAAVERKYRVLQQKLCAEMLQAHYGPSAWASLPQNVKEDKLSELELLVDCGLRKGSVLSLACLPGARLNVRSRGQEHEDERSMQCVSPSAMEGTAAQALQELRHRKQAETAALLAQQHLLVGSTPEASRRLLHLHAQVVLVQQEASFQAALLIPELFQGESFWDSQPIVPEACHQELAQLRLAGHGSEPAWREARMMPGRSMAQVLLDRLLLQHERDRACLVRMLQALAGTETAHETGQEGKQLVLPGAGFREDTSRDLREAIGRMLSLAQKRLEGSRGTEVPWQDCAVAVLVDLQVAQEEELRLTIEDLVGIVGGREGESCPALYESLLARLQEPLLMSLIRHLQPVPPQEKQTWELSPGEREAQKMLQRGDGLDSPQDQNKMEPQGPLLKKLKTCEHQDGGKDSEDRQNSVAPQRDQNCAKHQQESLDASLLQTKSKSWGPPEFVRPQVLMPKELRSLAVIPQIPQCKEEGLNCQPLNNPQGLLRGDVREATGHPPEIPSERKKAHLQGTEQNACRASQRQEEKDPEFSGVQEALLEKSKSLDPQELSRPWCEEDCGHLQREHEIPGPQDCGFPKDCQPERCQDQLQHHPCPGSEEKAVQVPEKEPEAAKRHDRQKPDALRKKTEASCPQELANTKACQTEPFCPQEKLQRHLGVPQATKPSKKAKKEPEAQLALSKKAKPPKPKETSRSQAPLESVHPRGMPEGRPQDFPQRGAGSVQGSLQGRRTPEKKSLGTIQEQKEPQNHHDVSQRKSKSLAPGQQGITQPRKGKEDVPPEGKARSGQEAEATRDSREPHKEKDRESMQGQGAALQRQKGVLQIQDYGRAESPPLLWRVLWQKAKSFDVGKPYVFPIEKLQKLEEALTHRLPPKRKGSPMAQLQIHSLREDQRPESPPLLWRILWQKSKSFELRKSGAFETRDLRRSLIARLQQGGRQEIPTGAHNLQEPKVRREAGHLPQGPRNVERPQAQGSPQKMTRGHEEAPGRDVQEQSQRMSTQDAHPQENRESETPPLLWRVLGMKAKSFELRRPGPRAFRTQQARKQEPSFLAGQEMKRLTASLRKGGPRVEPEPHRPGGPTIRYPQELQDAGPQRLQTTSQAGNISPQGSGALPTEMQPERRSPETPPLMWWVLEMGRQGRPRGEMEEEEEEENPLQLGPRGTSSGHPNTSGPKERAGLEASATQEKATKGCHPDSPSHCPVSPPGEQGGPGNPSPMKAQGMLGSKPGGFACSGPSQGGKIKSGNSPAPETLGHSKTDSPLPPGNLFGKSKSLDFRELRPPKPPELRELESPEAQGRPKAVQVQEGRQMEFKKLQPPQDPQTPKAQERDELEGLQAQGAPRPTQPQGRGGEIRPSLQSSLQLKPVELREPHVLPPQELVVLHVQGTLQVDPKALTFQRHVDPKAICLPGHQEPGSSRCEFQAEEKPTEMRGSPTKGPQDCLGQEMATLQANLIGNSASFGVQELSKPSSCQSQEKQEQAPRRAQAPEDHAPKDLETSAPQVTTQILVNPQRESPVQKDLRGGEISQPQEEREEKEPGAPNSQEHTRVEVFQLQETKEPEDLQPSAAPQIEPTALSSGAMDPRPPQVLPVEEISPEKPETPETTDHGKPSTWLSPGYSELWEFWRTLGKSKSLDLRGLRALQLEALGEAEFSRLREMSRTKIWQPQRKPQNDPVDVQSKFLPIHELIPKDQAAGQPQAQGGCEVQGPQLMGLEPLKDQEPLRTEAETLPSREQEDEQIFCPRGHEAIEAGGEPLHVPGAAERPLRVAEPRGLMELRSQENRDLESPPLLKGLLTKSKTLGPEMWARREAFQVGDVKKTESCLGQGTPKTQIHKQGSPVTQAPREEPQEMLNNIEGTQVPPRLERAEFQREASMMETGTAKGERPLFVACDVRPEEGDGPLSSPERSQALPPHQGPQFGIELLQELGRLNNDREPCGQPEQKDQEGVQPRETQEVFESEEQVDVEPQEVPHPQEQKHPGWQRTEPHQLAEETIPGALGALPGLEEDQGSCQSPEEPGSRCSPKLEGPWAPQQQECLPETSPGVPGVRVSHPMNSQEFRVPALFCPEESPEIGWESREDQGREVQEDSGRSDLQEHYALAPQGSLQWKTRSLDPQELSRPQDFPGQRAEEGPPAEQGEVRQLEQEAVETRRSPAVTLLSPPSPGRDEEGLTWEPAPLSVGISQESSVAEIQPGRASGLSWQAPEEGEPAEGEGATGPSLPEDPQARTWQLPSPRPPRREKAFIWLSRQEQEEALQQLAKLRAEGELRHRRDMERQTLRFQERLSIAKRRRSEDDPLGSSPAERWTPPTEHLGQDQAGRKTAVKCHLEKVKRERTYVMQSKRERNTLCFKELLDPLVVPGEESPEPGRLEGN